MTEGGISKKVVMGLMCLEAITTIAVSDENADNKIKYVYVLAAILVIYLFKQTFLDFMKNVWLIMKGKKEAE